MKLKFYAFHDALTNGYSQPFLQNNRAQAVRTARWKANEMWEKTNYAAQIEQMKKANLSPALMKKTVAHFVVLYAWT